MKVSKSIILLFLLLNGDVCYCCLRVLCPTRILVQLRIKGSQSGISDGCRVGRLRYNKKSAGARWANTSSFFLSRNRFWKRSQVELEVIIPRRPPCVMSDDDGGKKESFLHLPP